MDWFTLLEEASNWWTTAGGISTVVGIITGAVGTIAGIVIKCINEYRKDNHMCPVHCVTKKPLKPKKKQVANGKSKG